VADLYFTDLEKEIVQLLSIVDTQGTLIEKQEFQIKHLQNELSEYLLPIRIWTGIYQIDAGIED
jgi:hypothetical protein